MELPEMDILKIYFFLTVKNNDKTNKTRYPVAQIIEGFAIEKTASFGIRSLSIE